MGVVVQQYEVFLVALDPTLGREVQKTRPCVVLSPDEMNRTLGTTIIAPMTTKSHAFPTRIALRFQDKDGWIMLDQIRTVDRARMVKKLGVLEASTITQTKRILSQMLVE